MDSIMELQSLITEYIMKNSESDAVGNYLTQMEDDDDLLERYLRSSEGRAKRAWEFLKKYAQNRVEYPEIFPEKKSAHIKQLLKSNVVAILKRRDSKGRRVLVLASTWDTDMYSMDDVTLVITALLEATALEDGENPSAGVAFVQNFGGFEMKHVRQYTLYACRRYANIVLYSLPIELKEAMYVKTGSIMSAVLSVFKSFAPGDMKVQTSPEGKGFSELHEFIPKEILPKELGGPLDFEEATDKNILARCLE